MCTKDTSARVCVEEKDTKREGRSEPEREEGLERGRRERKGPSV